MFQVTAFVIAKRLTVENGRYTLHKIGKFCQSGGCAIYLEVLTDELFPRPLRAVLMNSDGDRIWESDEAFIHPDSPDFQHAFEVHWQAPPGIYSLVLESLGKKVASHVAIVP
jgi:hypothetical protein